MPSSIRPTRDSQVRLRTAPEEVTVSDWGLRDRPLASAVAVAVAAGAVWLSMKGTNSPAAGAVVATLLAIVLWRTWLPVRYQLNGSGIAQTVMGWRQYCIPWAAFRTYDVRTSGVLLLADEAATPLNPLRGFFLPWGSHRELVLAQIVYHLSGWNADISGKPQPPAQ